MIALIGLSILVLAWIVQMVILLKDKKSRKISNWFLIIYMIGVAFLVYDGFSSDVMNLAIANFLTLVLAGVVLLLIRNRK